MTWTPAPEAVALIAVVRYVLDDANADGLRLTLRGAFDQLVAAELIPKTHRASKRLSELTNSARWEGWLDLDCFDDLTRSPITAHHYDHLAAVLNIAVSHYRLNWWPT